MEHTVQFLGLNAVQPWRTGLVWFASEAATSRVSGLSARRLESEGRLTLSAPRGATLTFADESGGRGVEVRWTNAGPDPAIVEF